MYYGFGMDIPELYMPHVFKVDSRCRNKIRNRLGLNVCKGYVRKLRDRSKMVCSLKAYIVVALYLWIVIDILPC